MTAAASIVPSHPVVDGRGHATAPWRLFFNTLVRGAAPASAVVVGASPFAYTAPGFGTLSVSGGTVSGITITRGVTVVPTGQTSGLIPVSSGDVVTITYSVLPTVNFIPG